MISAAADALTGLTRPRAERQSDRELIAECLAGRQQAWDELVERYARLVHSVPRKCGLPDADAEDVFQNVFIQLFRRLDALRDGERVAAWLLTTAHREAWRVSRRRGTTLEPDVMEPDPGRPGEEEVARAEQRQLVRQALRRLGGRDAALLMALFSAPGQPNYEAIAQDLGMKVGSIGPTRARAFRKLEKILIEMGYRPDEASPGAEGLLHRAG